MILYDVTLMSEDDFFGTVIWANNVTEVCEKIAKLRKWEGYEITDCRIIPDTDPAYHEAMCPDYKEEMDRSQTLNKNKDEMNEIFRQIYRMCWKEIGETYETTDKHDMSNQELQECIKYRIEQGWMNCTSEEVKIIADVLEGWLSTDHRLNYDAINKKVTLSKHAYRMLTETDKNPSEI